MCFLCGNSISLEQHNIALRRISELENELRFQVDENRTLKDDAFDNQRRMFELESKEPDDSFEDEFYHASDVTTPTLFSILSYILNHTSLTNPFSDQGVFEDKIKDTLAEVKNDRIKEISYRIGDQKFHTSVNSLGIVVEYTVSMTHLTDHEILTLQKLTDGSFTDRIKINNNEMFIKINDRPIHLMYSFGAFGDSIDKLDVCFSYYIFKIDEDESPFENYAYLFLEKLSSHTFFEQWIELEKRSKKK
ncbi:hypothetical protein [Aeromonas media]|uniref:hypothetical protein n=1 Tax=Aeromonas media TaxID=651 RepID=UPI00111B2A57|nr:hypothetical protein [Aeromonas media]